MIHVGDCLDILPTLPERSVHCVVTSPPYFGLRSYGVGAENGEIGLEPTPDAFVAAMVRVFREVKRVLRDDGTVWLNLGDSYATNPGNGRGGEGSGLTKGGKAPHRTGADRSRFGNKQLLGIPWRVAFALQADGWYLRSDIIWHKPNPMPESVRDRPTKSHEYMFLLTKSPRYYWDAEAVKEEGASPRDSRPDTRTHEEDRLRSGRSDRQMAGHTGFGTTGTRNIRSVWTLPTKSFRGAHFATFPPRLVEPCVKAGTSEKGACPACGKPWVRVVEREKGDAEAYARPKHLQSSRSTLSLSGNGSKEWAERGARSTTTGWRPDCTCGTERPIPDADLEADPTLIDDFEIEPFPPIPCTVLDPFSGAGTVGLVAKQLGRSFVGIELNPDYATMAEARIAKGA